MAPLAVALAFRHAARALGVRRAALEMIALATYGFAVEVVAMAVFGSHRYAASWRVAPLGVPVAVAGVWAAIIIAAMAVAWRYGAVSPLARAATAALVAVALDMLIEPVATRGGLWSWTPPGPWLGVPIGNFVGWMVIVGAYAYGAERWARGRGGAMAIARRAALAAACIVALVAVGLVWTRLGLERGFADGRGWIAWVAVLGAVMWRVSLPRADWEAGARAAGGGRWGGLGGERGASPAPRRRSPPSLVTPEHSLPALLAATPGRGPEAVLCVVALAFAVEALRIAEPGVQAAAAGSLATIGTVAAANLRRRPA